MDKKQLQYWDTGQQEYLVEPGEYEIMVGGSSEDIKLINLIVL